MNVFNIIILRTRELLRDDENYRRSNDRITDIDRVTRQDYFYRFYDDARDLLMIFLFVFFCFEISQAAQTTWPVKNLISGSPLFTYEGEEAQNFTIPRVRAGLYRLEIKSIEEANGIPNTVLLYATSSALDHSPIKSHEATAKGKHRQHSLRFQQRRSRRRLTVSWSKRFDFFLFFFVSWK